MIRDDFIILIPAYNPNYELYKIINKLYKNKYSKIVVINDGSKKIEIFNKIKNKAIVINHEINKGKGIALKTGIEYCLKNFPNTAGIITVDADGQHLIEDINKIYEKLKYNNNGIILGSRNFKGKEIPIRNKIGNILFRNILEIKTKIKLQDTQTGLRGIPIQYLKEFKNIKGEHYEYETNMLLYCIKNDIKVSEININNVYINKNKSSCYKPIKDSIKIMLVLFNKKSNI